MAVTLEPYRDRANGFELLLPTDWEHVDPPADEVRLVAVEPLAGQGFRTNVVVTLDDLPDGLGLEGWQDGNDLMLPTMLEAWQLLDRVTERRDSGTDGSATVVRRLGHHNHGGAPVTMRQVALTSGGRGLTLTTSIWTPAYPEVLNLVAQIERSFPRGSGDEPKPSR